jgi:hypothetical protein
MMEYRDIEYTVVQGIGRHLWKWSASVADVVIMGQAHSKSAAAEAEKAIDRALALKKVRLVPPKGETNTPYPFGIHR